MPSKRSKTFLVFFGPPGSGKGTQADVLANKLKLPIVSPGELLRHEEDKKTPLGLRVRKLVDNGKMVSDRIIYRIVDERLKKKDANNGAVFDGYPRREQQLKSLINRFKKITKSGDNILAILIDIKDNIVRQRLGGRRVCDCGASYHVKYNPPKLAGKCDLCGKKISVRKDDSLKVMNNRLHYYHQHIKPMLDYWKENDALVVINGEQKIEKIEKDLEGALSKRGVLIN